MGTETDKPEPGSPEGPSQPWRIGEAMLSCSQKYSVTCIVIEEHAACFGVTEKGVRKDGRGK